MITKLTEGWRSEQRTFSQRNLSAEDYRYVWADGIHVNLRSKNIGCVCSVL